MPQIEHGHGELDTLTEFLPDRETLLVVGCRLQILPLQPREFTQMQQSDTHGSFVVERSRLCQAVMKQRGCTFVLMFIGCSTAQPDERLHDATNIAVLLTDVAQSLELAPGGLAIASLGSELAQAFQHHSLLRMITCFARDLKAGSVVLLGPFILAFSMWHKAE